MGSSRVVSVAIAGIVAFAGIERAAWADEVARAAEEPTPDARTLGGHTFLRPVLDDSAFLPTTVGFRQGVFLVDAGTVAAGGATKAVTMAAAVETLDGAVRVVDWLAIAATADLEAVVGASEVALYSNASALSGGLRFGPVLRLLRLAGTQVALRPYFRGAFGAVLDIGHVLPSLRDRAAQEAATPPTSASEAGARASALEQDLLSASVIPLRRSAFGASLHAAQALGPYVGLQVSYDLRREGLLATPYDLPTRRRAEVPLVAVYHTVTAQLELDAARLGVPLGVTLEGELRAGSLGGDGVDTRALDTTILVGPGLYYTGRNHAQLGIFGAVKAGQSRYDTVYGPSGLPLTYYGQFSLRQYF
jgi:hypothetical protein